MNNRLRSVTVRIANKHFITQLRRMSSNDIRANLYKWKLDSNYFSLWISSFSSANKGFRALLVKSKATHFYQKALRREDNRNNCKTGSPVSHIFRHHKQLPLQEFDGWRPTLAPSSEFHTRHSLVQFSSVTYWALKLWQTVCFKQCVPFMLHTKCFVNSNSLNYFDLSSTSLRLFCPISGLLCIYAS